MLAPGSLTQCPLGWGSTPATGAARAQGENFQGWVDLQLRMHRAAVILAPATILLSADHLWALVPQLPPGSCAVPQ